MSKEVRDALIAMVVRDADTLLAKLDLNDEERAWSRTQAKHVFHDLTETLFTQADDVHRLNAVVVSAALAYALTLAQTWAVQQNELKEKFESSDRDDA